MCIVAAVFWGFGRKPTNEEEGKRRVAEPPVRTNLIGCHGQSRVNSGNGTLSPAWFRVWCLP